MFLDNKIYIFIITILHFFIIFFKNITVHIFKYKKNKIV